jgi:hypothetical protein
VDNKRSVNVHQPVVILATGKLMLSVFATDLFLLSVRFPKFPVSLDRISLVVSNWTRSPTIFIQFRYLAVLITSKGFSYRKSYTVREPDFL